jgi:hypothetical protein
MQLLNDQLELFNQVRDIVSLPIALSTYPAAAIREIRALYADFDKKHPQPAQMVDS